MLTTHLRDEVSWTNQFPSSIDCDSGDFCVQHIPIIHVFERRWDVVMVSVWLGYTAQSCPHLLNIICDNLINPAPGHDWFGDQWSFSDVVCVCASHLLRLCSPMQYPLPLSFVNYLYLASWEKYLMFSCVAAGIQCICLHYSVPDEREDSQELHTWLQSILALFSSLSLH